MWKKLKNAIQEAADKIMGPIKHTKGKKWFDGECKNAVESQNKARLTMLKYPSMENKENYTTAKK